MAVRYGLCVLLIGILFPALPGCAGDGPFWHSEEWYQARACDPPGARQFEKHGKLWPPYPRPAGKGMAYWHRYHHAHYWPYPYNSEDRDFVNNAMQQQAVNGWEIATTLHDYHFSPETHRLNTAGEAHLRWILTQAPAAYRKVNVSRGTSEVIGQIRMAQVVEVAHTLVGNDCPPIQLKYDDFLGRPAMEIDTLRRLELQSMPPQRLFSIGSGGGSASAPSSSQAGGTSGAPKTP